MTRHGRNATASAVYSYHERKKDAAKGKYGSQTVRLSKDSIKDFDCCSLTLQPCRNPVITPDGYLYDKEAILECLLHQKRENARKMKEYEKQKRKHEAELEELGEAEARSKVSKFLSTEGSIVSRPVNPFTPGGANEGKERATVNSAAPTTSQGQSSSASAVSSSGSSASADEVKSKPKLPSFWVPSLTPDAKPTEIKKPDNKTYCPTSGRPLKVKDLIAVKFTPIADRDTKTATIVKQARYVCPVTHDVLGNSIPCAVLKSTGDIVTMECVDKLIRPNDMVCPLSGKKLKESDIIPIIRGGTGFASSGNQLKATKQGAVLMA